MPLAAQNVGEDYQGKIWHGSVGVAVELNRLLPRQVEAKMEQDRVERDDGGLSVSTLREGWERPSRDIRRFRS